MKRAFICVLLLLVCTMLPTVCYTEDAVTVRLARTIYALAGSESYEAKLAIGSVAANRAESPWFAHGLEAVLTEQHQFPCGSRYDAQSLRAAHEIVAGKRTLPAKVLYYHALDASEAWPDTALYAAYGNLGFYTESGD